MINSEDQFIFNNNKTAAIVKCEYDAMISTHKDGIWVDKLNIPFNVMCKLIHNHDCERIRSELKSYLNNSKLET